MYGSSYDGKEKGDQRKAQRNAEVSEARDG